MKIFGVRGVPGQRLAKGRSGGKEGQFPRSGPQFLIIFVSPGGLLVELRWFPEVMELPKCVFGRLWQKFLRTPATLIVDQKENSQINEDIFSELSCGDIQDEYRSSTSACTCKRTRPKTQASVD